MSDFSTIHPDNGIDRKQLKQLKQRFLLLNSTRLDRTREAIGIRQQLFLDVLPLLLHVNHPMLPGYQGSDTPSGIPYFKPDTIQISAAKMIARSFEIKKNLAHKELSIDSIFMMGSVGTIAHSERSDFDIWVCHKSKLQQEDLEKLERKCEEISRWADRELNVEAHFFSVAADSATNSQAGSMSSESSGTAQKHLLLDEFYRSAIWIAGKVPLWWYVPTQEETNYETFTNKLLTQKFVRRQDVIDFGPITHIPQDEYLGAGIWQLYKGIQAPHKSALKLMLLEAYAAEGSPTPLALDFKSRVHRAEPDPDQLDSYLLIFQRIESYFLKTEQADRLELARRCLYFKVDKPLTRAPGGRSKSWQRLILEQLVNSWQWSNTQLLRLDAHRYWKANQVIQERDALIKELSKSYRLLGGLSRRSFQDASINSQELAVLGRKLHAAFERKSGKIERINPDISRDLSETFLCICGPSDSNSEWQVYRERRQTLEESGNRRTPLKEADSLYALIVWCLWNGVLDASTKLDILLSRPLHEAEKRLITQRTAQWLPNPQASAEHEAFLQTAEVKKVQAAVNLTIVPYETLDKQGLKLLSEQSDALNYSGLHDNLVQSVDIAYINSWNELIVRSYRRDALSELVLAYLRFAPPHIINTPPELDIFCPDQQFGALIENRLYELFGRLTQCFYGARGNAAARYLIETHRQFYIVQFNQGSPAIIKLRSLDELYDYLETPQSQDKPLILDSKALLNSSLRAIIESVVAGHYCLYYEFSEERVDYTYVDISGALFRFSAAHLEKNAFPTPIINFISAVSARLSAHGGLFALDHFEALNNAKPLGVKKVLRSGQKYLIEDDNRVSSLRINHFADIKVIAEPSPDKSIVYDLYCDDELYSHRHGDPFINAARYISSQRSQNKTYHCYINDLDLTACTELLAPETGLQLIHYLQQKRSIEERLNRALQSL